MARVSTEKSAVDKPEAAAIAAATWFQTASVARFHATHPWSSSAFNFADTTRA